MITLLACFRVISHNLITLRAHAVALLIKTYTANTSAAIWSVHAIFFCIGMAFRTMRLLAIYSASFGHHIPHIISMSTYEKVAAALTWRVITFMQHVMIGRNWAVLLFISYSVRRNHFFFILHASIAIASFASPYPTLSKFGTMLRNGAVLIDFSPEAYFQQCRRAMSSKQDRCMMILEKAVRLALDVAACGNRLRANICKLAAATFTKVCGNGRLRIHRKTPFGVMSQDVSSVAEAFIFRTIIAQIKGVQNG